ncbi:unnamed protein product [Haemonchus placei]|uniref:CYTH domain-containing protein n=1 Tax=Haemonchus placei TaxID=6290 RepID=A0A0N4WTR4_HAEPC|nr:unnamed protein product [Haemonchus placei]
MVLVEEIAINRCSSASKSDCVIRKEDKPATLGAALGERGTITKKRRVFTMDDVRIYLDDVDQIGQFIDIAVTLNSSQPEACYARAKEIRDRLNIDEDAVVPAAYLDMMMENLSFDDDTPTRKSTKSGSETESEDST